MDDEEKILCAEASHQVDGLLVSSDHVCSHGLMNFGDPVVKRIRAIWRSGRLGEFYAEPAGR